MNYIHYYNVGTNLEYSQDCIYHLYTVYGIKQRNIRFKSSKLFNLRLNNVMLETGTYLVSKDSLLVNNHLRYCQNGVELAHQEF